MANKKNESEPNKVLITLEVEESPTNCCECTFGYGCPHQLADILDCARYNLESIKIAEIKNKE